MKFKGKNVPHIVFVFICHTELDYNYKKIKRRKLQEEMARMPKGNYKAYVNQASSIKIFPRWHKNYDDGYKILSDGKLK